MLVPRGALLPIFLLILPLSGLIGCGGSSNSSQSSNTQPPAASNVNVTISPSITSVEVGTSEQFTATVTGSTNTAVNWNVNGVAGGNTTLGTVTPTGNYTAPVNVPNPNKVNLNAVSQADSTKTATASVTITVHQSNQNAQTFPIKLGTSGGNINDTTTSGNTICCTAGTLGALVQRGGKQYILSNNHVLDKSDQGAAGDPISQPGLGDANCDATQVATVAHMTQSAPLRTGNVDAALALVVNGAVDSTGAILGIGPSNGAAAPPASTTANPSTVLARAATVAKSGRSTGVTCSTLQSVDTDTLIDYSTACSGGQTFSVQFSGQIVVNGGSFSGSGDSGALVVTADTAQPIGLLYGGSTTNSVANPIQDVLNALADPTTHEVPLIVGGGQHSVACPPASQSLAVQVPATPLSDSEISRATTVRIAHEKQLLSTPGVLRVDVGRSEDNSTESALIIYVQNDASIKTFPPQIGGVRTKMVSAQQSAVQTIQPPRPVDAEQLAHASAMKRKYGQSLLKTSGIIGVGVGSSNDAPGLPAIIVYLEQGKQASVPAVLDGIRTRIIVTERFRANHWGNTPQPKCPNPANLDQ